jgi:mannose-6-phosphate isomerase-like protein (cupin superfamily)
MQVINGVFASFIFWFGIWVAPDRSHVVDQAALRVDGVKEAVAASAGQNNRVNSANSIGVETLAGSSPSRVTYFNSEAVEASFAKGVGVQLHDGKVEGENWALNTDDREEPAPVVSHAHTTEINIIIAGRATYVVGGSIVNPTKGKYPEDTSGTAIQGGETYHLLKGDVIIVPNGVPHWFKEAHGFRYFLVRVHD